MEITKKQLIKLQNRLKVGNRRSVHLNAVPGRSKYKFDLTRLSHMDENLPNDFINALLAELPLKFKVSWKDKVSDLNSLTEEDQIQLVKITRSFENLINQTDAIESEKGINTFGFGFPILVRRDKSDKKLTVAPILIWSLRIKRTKEFNTWKILRDENDPIYINEVLINHLQNDSDIKINQIPSEHLDDGLIDENELLDICVNITEDINGSTPQDLREIFEEKLNKLKPIPDKKYYEKLPLTSNNSFIDFGGLFSIFEVQKQNIIYDYEDLLELSCDKIDLAFGKIDTEDMNEYSFQPISSVETDPSQQGILHSLNTTRNILIQGPPGTGKSQSLTAILVNALENHKKTIVVCEKRTALEVLYKALNEKNLNYQLVLIKDIVKDRRLVVNSVRERIDNSSFPRYQYAHSKETLDNIIEKSKSLIDTINKTHQKVGEELIEKKNWTSVIGRLLHELKDNTEDYNLNLVKKTFSYESAELNELLELIRKGQNLYNDYKPFKELSFLKSSKLVGDNPDIIKQQIKDNYLFYEKEYSRIKQKTKDFHKEYFDIRKNEINDKIEEYHRLAAEFQRIYNSVHQLIENIKSDFINIRNIEFKDELIKIQGLVGELRKRNNLIPKLLERFKTDYIEIRTTEFQNELHKIQDSIDRVRSIFLEYSSNILFLDDDKVNSFNFKIKSLFSKKLKKLTRDRSTVAQKILEIESISFKSKDLPKNKFGTNFKENKKSFFIYLDTLEKLKIEFNSKITNELEELNLCSFINEDIGSQSCLQKLANVANYRSNQFNKLIANTISKFREIESVLVDKKKSILNFIKSTRDLPPINFSSSFETINKDLNNYFDNIEKSYGGFIEKIKNEIINLDILKSIDITYKTQSFDDINKSYKNLKNRINQDSWEPTRLNEKEEESLKKKISKIIETKNEFFNNENDLFLIEFKWFKFYNFLLGKEKLIIDQLIEKENWRKIFLIYYLNSMLVNSANMNLPTDDNDHIELNKSLSELGKEQIKYIKEYWFSKQIDATKYFNDRNPNIAVENLYNKRSSNKHKRLSLREIVKLDMDLFTTFFPIILTTPEVASNLFKGKNKYFDIVMFDEASQLKLEDNLPVLLKGKQIIISGDEHQMPPSNYFSKIFDGTIEDEDEFEEEEDKIKSTLEDSILDCESLLDFAGNFNFEKKYLDFHYRSEHPYLIDYSNYAFYNQRLKPLPNSFNYIPINYVSVNGTYSDHSNDAEAENVLSIIDNISRLSNGEYPTIGVATFNINQRNLILGKINDRRKSNDFENFNEKIVELENNGLFVKNLENIQGDEREVMILSTTYGINKEGKFAQRFGSINHQKGYKLLNVIITRAKYRIYVCSSIPEEIFLDYKKHLETEGNNRRGVLYAYLTYAKAVSEQDNEARESVLKILADNSKKDTSIDNFNDDLESPFEEEVYETLTEHFDKDKIKTQLKFGGFRIDLVYETKNIKIAIECDGAKYHSSQEAYLYDRHRQKILEGHGFVFHRIWSTNWWRSPKKETQKLIEFIKNNENNNSSAFDFYQR